jgi:SNF2 family DNA or RNA helicase
LRPLFSSGADNKSPFNDEASSSLSRQLESEVASRHWKLSGKLRVLLSFLRDWREKDPSIKVLIFSQTKKVLDIIEKMA